MLDREDLSRQIQAATGQQFQILDVQQIGGGCINQACRLVGATQCYFLKMNRLSLLPMFEAEFAGLQEMAKSNSVKVPQPVVCGLSGDQSFLIMEMIDFGARNGQSEMLLGKQLAQMHRAAKPYFGWHCDNTIGSTPQMNARHHLWVEFWRQQRLIVQLRFAAEKGFAGRLQTNGERLCAEVDSFFSEYTPRPVLLHGDLWSGNAATDQQGNPVIYDPACYYGDHEADLAMTELFGGFGADFYAAYRETLSVDPGYSIRKTLYNLYHILNHLNLFGGAYLSQAEGMMEQLLAEVK